jgi:hypothetical protein
MLGTHCCAENVCCNGVRLASSHGRIGPGIVALYPTDMVLCCNGSITHTGEAASCLWDDHNTDLPGDV